MKIKLIPIKSPIGKIWWHTYDESKFDALIKCGFKIEKDGGGEQRASASIQSGAIAKAIDAGIVEDIWENGQFDEK